ncbi:MAG: hypothetical protein IT374_09260 [Polyangiaceae bacterium]|nr:hypothetical protein [Polyangiaceae bacterium]
MPITHTASSHQSLMPIAPRLAASRHADAIVGPTRPQSAMPIAPRLAASRHADAIVGPTRPQSAMPIASRPQRIH